MILRFLSLVFLSTILIFSITKSQQLSCPQFKLIQPLNTSTGFSHVIIADGNYFLISQNKRKYESISPTGRMPPGFEKIHGALLFDQSICSQPNYYLVAYKVRKN